MIVSFGDKNTESIFNGLKNKDTRKIDSSLLRKIERKLDLINASAVIEDLKYPPGNKLEKLVGNFKEYHSIRVDGQWRIIFKWVNNSACEVKFTDYH